MKYRFERDKHQRRGVISNLHSFIARHLDTGFKSKWSGFWVPPYKYIDYYGFKVNGVWLGADTCNAVEYGDEMVFHHESDSFRIKEKVEMIEQEAAFKISLEMENISDAPKAVRVAMETAVDIREKSQDIGPAAYHVEKEDSIKVSSDERYLEISGEELEFKGDAYIKEHEPGERQRCLVPGEIVRKTEMQGEETIILEYRFQTDQEGGGTLEHRQQETRCNLFDRAFEASVRSMENLTYKRNGYGIIAGHPWFQSYWARDSFWTLLGFIDAGHFELAEKMLENYAERGIPGKIALDGNEENFPRSDSEPLYIIAADKLRKHYETTDTIEKGMKKAMEALDMKENIAQHDAMGTWMDTLEREPAIDIQSLWLESARIMNDSRARKLKKGLKRYEKEKYPKDFLGKDSPRAVNAAVPLMFGHFGEDKASRYLERLNAEFSSKFGARTRSVSDPGYQSDGYHNGSAWGLTTGWAAGANAQYGKEQRAINFLQRLEPLMDRNQPGGIPEVVDAEKGHLLGCPEQAWSAGMLVHIFDSYMLGMRPEDGKLKVDPFNSIECIRRDKRIGDKEVDLRFENGEVEVIDGEVEIERC